MDGPGPELQMILAAYERTVAAGLARGRFEFDSGWGDADWGSVSERLPAWMRVVGRVTRPLTRRVVGTAPEADDPEEGIVDLAGHRSAMCPRYRPITMVIGSQQWYARPGEVLKQSDSFAADSTQPLWLLALVKRAVHATEDGSVRIRGEPCRVFSITADCSTHQQRQRTVCRRVRLGVPRRCCGRP